jgi:cell fate regulator YaaT (PSP1 superfamily)
VLIEVLFKGNRKEFFDWPFAEAPAPRTAVIVEVERGEDLGRVHATGELAERRKAGTTHGKAAPDPLRKALRAATADDVARGDQLRAEEMGVRKGVIEKVRALGLPMKVSDTEWQWDRKRLTVYFTAEERVDFRSLVRQVEGSLGTRVHMWHIGVRDEAKRLDGVGRCGRQLCSASWLPELNPVKSSVAKDQHLSTLNPAQISGSCGRLMCCLRYEHEFYVQQRRRFPKEGKIVATAAGEEKVISLDIFRETVTLRSQAGETRVIPLAQLQQDAASSAWQATEDDTPGTADEGDARPDAPRAPEARIAQRPRPDRQATPRPGGPRDGAPRDGGQRPPRQGPPPRAQQAPPTATPAGTPAPQGAGGTAPPGVEADGAQSGGGRKRRRGRRGGRRGRGQPGNNTQGGGNAAQGPGPDGPGGDNS